MWVFEAAFIMPQKEMQPVIIEDIRHYRGIFFILVYRILKLNSLEHLKTHQKHQGSNHTEARKGINLKLEFVWIRVVF